MSQTDPQLTEVQAAVAQYLKDHQISEKFNVYVKKICKERPQDPLVLLDQLVRSDFEPKILSIKARQIFDSRGNPTIEVDVETPFGLDRADVPSGASTGVYEALELRDGGDDYHGKAVMQAVNNVNNIIAPRLIGMDPRNQKEIDDIMVKELDGQQNEWGWSKSKLGANAILGVSLAVCRAGARAKSVPLYRHIADLAGNKDVILPVPSFNIINGGEHAANTLAFQEFMILPIGAETFTEAMKMGSEVYHHLKAVIKSKHGVDAVKVGDEGGFAPNIKDAAEGLELIQEAITRSGYGDKIRIGMDVAASEFYNAETKIYDLEYKIADGNDHMKKNGDDFITYYQELVDKYNIISIEDPFDQDDFATYTKMTSQMGTPVQIVGDDLLVTNPTRIQKAIDEKACNALLLKVNQIGTISESIEAVALAKEAGWGVMTSHRSGETEDSFIADLAVGLNTGQIKTGAPARSERLAKYNQLLRIEEELGESARYAGSSFRKPE